MKYRKVLIILFLCVRCEVILPLNATGFNVVLNRVKDYLNNNEISVSNWKDSFNNIEQNILEQSIRNEKKELLIRNRYFCDIKRIITSTLHYFSLSSTSFENKSIDIFLESRYFKENDQRQLNGILSFLYFLFEEQNEGCFNSDRTMQDSLEIIKPSISRAQEEKLIEHDVRNILDIVLRCMLESNLLVKFYDYDYLDDIENIIKGRYFVNGIQRFDSDKFDQKIFKALNLLCASQKNKNLSVLLKKLCSVQNGKHSYVPQRGNVSEWVYKLIPDLVDEFINLRAEDNLERFLEINKEYSHRQFIQGKGGSDNRPLSLIRGNETIPFLTLDTVLHLIKNAEIDCKNDEVLIVGSRYVNELLFFKNVLGFSSVIGLWISHLMKTPCKKNEHSQHQSPAFLKRVPQPQSFQK